MMPRTVALLFLLTFLSLMPSLEAAEIQGPRVTVREDGIMVSTGITPDERQVEEIKKGVSKEIVFYVDLFRVWRSWPDEFVIGRKFKQTLSCDPVRKEYVATSLSGNVLKEKRFSSCERLISWALAIPEFRLTAVEELEPSEYFVKVTVESRLRRLPPFIDLLFFFVQETEFSLAADSPRFPLKSGK